MEQLTAHIEKLKKVNTNSSRENHKGKEPNTSRQEIGSKSLAEPLNNEATKKGPRNGIKDARKVLVVNLHLKSWCWNLTCVTVDIALR